MNPIFAGRNAVKAFERIAQNGSIEDRIGLGLQAVHVSAEDLLPINAAVDLCIVRTQIFASKKPRNRLPVSPIKIFAG